jgi:outer membrane immunogenic protein
MRRVTAAAAGLLMSIFGWTAASAIDTSIGPQSRNWDGFYIGLNASHIRANARWTDQFGFTTGDFSGEGTSLGFTAGKNWQSGLWVYGVEGDLARSILRAEIPAFACFPLNCQSELTSLATLRGRIGFLLSPDLLIFGTAGLAAGNLRHGNFLFASANNTALGYAAGAGVEARVAQNWTLKAEYIFVDLESNEACSSAICLISVQNNKFNAHAFRLGLNWHFDQSAAPQLHVVPAVQWSGFYAGMIFGYGHVETEWSDSFGFRSGPFDGSGGVAGLNAGFNWQSGRWVYGLEADGAFAKIKTENCCFTIESQIQHLFTLRGRLGYLVTPTTLLYASGGVAAASIKHGFVGVQTASALEVGSAVGAGLELQLAQNWTMKGEYLLIKFKDSDVCGFNFICFPAVVTSDYLDIHLVRFGFNRYF